MKPIRSTALSLALVALLVSPVFPADVGTNTRVLGRLIERALSSGQHAQLSPHLSVLLNVNHTEGTTPLHQLGISEAGTMWLFDVCDDDHSHIVLMRVLGGTAVEAYAMTPAGMLLKSVAYTVGGETRVLAAAQATAGFNGQLDFWLHKESALESAH